VNLIDSFFERQSRRIAQRSSRRGVLIKLGGLLVGSSIALPVLPYDRSNAGPARKLPVDDETTCEYWRHCALDGFICSCCGGTPWSCPPGSEVSKVTWVGTCRNPHDGKNYLISYNDCCGTTGCGRCMCNRNEGERPGYRMGTHNDVDWCMANASNTYHCTIAAIVGIAD